MLFTALQGFLLHSIRIILCRRRDTSLLADGVEVLARSGGDSALSSLMVSFCQRRATECWRSYPLARQPLEARRYTNRPRGVVASFTSPSRTSEEKTDCGSIDEVFVDLEADIFRTLHWRAARMALCSYIGRITAQHCTNVRAYIAKAYIPKFVRPYSN